MDSSFDLCIGNINNLHICSPSCHQIHANFNAKRDYLRFADLIYPVGALLPERRVLIPVPPQLSKPSSIPTQQKAGEATEKVKAAAPPHPNRQA